MRVQQPRHTTREPSECCMHSIVRQNFTIDPISRGGGNGSDDVGGVDVFDVHILNPLFDFILQPGSHIF